MRHYVYWPWHLAYAGQKAKTQDCNADSIQKYDSRWHGRGAAGFGVRRPLRYLAHHLDLDEGQTRRMAAVLNQLKTEREQAQLDEKRTVTALAALMGEAKPTLEEVRSVLAPRVDSASRLSEETAKAVVAVSDFLDDDQREEFVNLLLTGAISL